ncbi:LVIVD repeat-containing protein [Natronococcus wangiae]|uniref:LVIVD repeat-containing protein n=1 Tax=Natronococcus wangiae TaxID=3068275 RepID=UPI00273DC291|nr:hypothetical protein [Natronococcus sp. AD5]
MRRRTLLRAGVVAGTALSIPGAGSASVAAATRQDSYEPLGRVSVDGATEAVVGDAGNVAYLAVADGFATVDVSDPAEPTILAEERGLEADDRPLTDILDVDVDGDRLALVGPAHGTARDVFHGFVVYDVSDPETPEPVTDPYETGYHIHNCYLEDDLLFVVANDEDENPLVIFDVGDGVEEVGRWSLLDREPGWRDVFWRARYNHDVYVRDGIAYVAHWDPGTYLLDVSDPTEPEYVSHVSGTDLEFALLLEGEEAQFGLPGNDHYSAVDDAGDLLAVGREAWATGGDEPDGPGGIDLYDVSDPAEPEFQSSIDAPAAADETYEGGLWTTAHNFEIRGGRLYASWYQGGVTIHDVGDPVNPEELAGWRDPAEAAFWTARVAEPGETFVASSTEMVPNTTIEGALYTFPIEAGEQADPPSLTDPGELETDADEDEAENGTTDGGTSEDADADADTIPGFTAVGAAGAAGGAVALEWLRRRRDGRR